MDERTEISNTGVELCLNSIYVIVLACSYFLIVKMFVANDSDYRTAYVNCFILVVPCVIDGVKELLNYAKKQKLFVNIVDLVFGILCFVIAACLLFAIITNIESKIFANIVVYCSIVCVCSYAAHLASALIDACKSKFSKAKEK